MKFANKLFALILCITLLFSVLPASIGFYTSADSSAEVLTGNLDDNISYIFDKTTGSLTITGNGAIRDFKQLWATDDPFLWGMIPEDDELTTDAPWGGMTERDLVRSLAIGEGITEIGQNAFYYCSHLVTVTLPFSLQNIKYSAFDGCYALTDVYYSGTESYWNNITISSGNTELSGATMHYSSAPAHEHNYAAVVTSPTCAVGGYTTYTCTICGDSYVDDYTPATGQHAYNAVSVPATCTAQGYTVYTCVVCGSNFVGNYTPVTTHNYSTVVTPPSCVEKGYTTHTCTGCGDSYTDNYTDPIGEHHYTANVTKPTCTEQGYTTHTCSVCGDTYQDTYVNATGHKYMGSTTAPTCTEQGYTTHTCLVCGDTYQDTYTSATGHDYGKWKIRKKATCTATGERYRVCKNCDKEETEDIPAEGHHFKDDMCTVCGQMDYSGHFYFTVENGEATITGGDDTLSGSITFPETLGPYPVRKIWDNAFMNRTEINSVTIPSSVTYIGDSAFRNCNLTYARVENENAYLGDYSFYSFPNGERRNFYIPKTTTRGYRVMYLNLNTYIGDGELLEHMQSRLARAEEKYGIYSYYVYDSYEVEWERVDWKGNVIERGVTTMYDYSIVYYMEDSDRIHWIGGESAPSKYINYETGAEVDDVTALYEGKRMLVSKSGFRTIDIQDSTLTSAGQKTIALVPSTYKGKSAGVTAVHANGVDVLANTLNLRGDKGDTLTLRAYVTQDADPTDEFALLCDDKVIKTSSNGEFKLRAGQLRKGSYTLRHGSVEYPLRLHVLSETPIDVDLDDVFSFTVPNDVPIIGGKQFDFSVGGITFNMWEKDDKIRVTFGVEVDSDDLYDSFASQVDSFADDYVTAEDLLDVATRFQQLNGFHPWQGAATTGGEFGASANFCGYCEISYDGNGKPQITAGRAIFGISGRYGAEWQTVVATIPIVLKASGEIGAQAAIGFFIDANDAVNLLGNFEVTLPKITVSAGVGLVKVADISVYGSLTNTISRDFAAGVTTGTASGEAGVSLSTFLFSQKFKLWDIFKWEYYNSAKKRGAPSKSKGVTDIKDAITEMMQEENFTIERANDGKAAQWLGAGGASRGSKGANTATLLQNNVYENAKAQTVTLADGRRLMVWLADIAERDDYNYTAVVYSIYDPATGLWSAPQILSDDGTADFEPVLSTDGTKTVVAWCNTNTVFSEGVTISEMASHCEICIAEFDSTTGTFGNALTLTDNSQYDCMPSLTIQNGNWILSWVKNNGNDPLLFTGQNTIYIRKENGELSTTGTMAYPVIDQAIGMIGNDLSISYITDADGDFTTLDDRTLYAAKIGQTATAIATGEQNNITFAAFDGENCLVWYMNGDLYYISAFDEIPQVLLEHAPDGQFSIVSDGNKTVLLCAVPNPNNGEDGSNLVSYIYEDGTLGEPEQIAAENGNYIGSISTYIDGNGNVRATYLKKTVTFTEDDLEVTAALYDTAITTSAPPAPIDTTYADLDGDGEINAEDLTVCTQALLLDGDADTNNDGVTNILDLIFVKKILQAA